MSKPKVTKKQIKKLKKAVIKFVHTLHSINTEPEITIATLCMLVHSLAHAEAFDAEDLINQLAKTLVESGHLKVHEMPEGITPEDLENLLLNKDSMH